MPKHKKFDARARNKKLCKIVTKKNLTIREGKKISKMRRNILEKNFLKIAEILHTKNKPLFRDKNWEPL